MHLESEILYMYAMPCLEFIVEQLPHLSTCNSINVGKKYYNTIQICQILHPQILLFNNYTLFPVNKVVSCSATSGKQTGMVNKSRL
jgi:hypothetical protein